MTEARAKANTWGSVITPFADVLSAPSYAGSRETQVLQGDVVSIEGYREGWCKVRVKSQSSLGQGYPGWVRREKIQISATEPAEANCWIKELRAPWNESPSELGQEPSELGQEPSELVQEPGELGQEPGERELERHEQLHSHFMYYGTGLQLVETCGDWCRVIRRGRGDSVWVRRAFIAEAPLKLTPSSVVNEVRRFLGTSYLWGGLSVLGIDCSGLMYMVFKRHGVILPRDSAEQYREGESVNWCDMQPGDLLFFGNKSKRVTHVGMYIGEGKMLHAYGRLGVVVSELDASWQNKCLGVRRICK